MVKILPAILEEDGDVAVQLCAQLSTVADAIQIDFADGTMTDETSCDLYDLVDACAGVVIEVHLMTTQPEDYFDACDALGASLVYFHVGEVESPSRVLDAAAAYGFKIGIALSPQTRVDDAAAYMDRVDHVQVMTVVPGRQGGVFLHEMLGKVAQVRDVRADVEIAVDGGVNAATLHDVVTSGADVAALGSVITRAAQPVAAYTRLCAAADKM